MDDNEKKEVEEDLIKFFRTAFQEFGFNSELIGLIELKRNEANRF